MTKHKRQVRIRQIPKRFNGKTWEMSPQPIVRLGEVGRWSMVRVAAYPQAAPFVITSREWDKLPVQGDGA